MYKKITLKNGLRILVVPAKSTKAVTVMALVGTGSKYETKEISGISHFLEHMFFKGTKKRPDKVRIAEDVDKVGGNFNAFTGTDYTGYWAKVAYQKFDLAMDWVSDIYLNSLLPADEIDKERGVIIEEINMYYDHPMRYIGNLWQELLYGDQPAGWDIAGTKETVKNMTRGQMFDYRALQYVASNTIVVVAGNVAVPQALSKARKYFAGIKSSEPKKKVAVSESQDKPGFLLQKRACDQTHVALGVRGYNVFHPKRYALEVMATILGGMMSSRLFIEVREKLGLAYHIRVDNTMDPETGSLAVMAGLDSKRIDLGITTILNEFKKIKEEKVSVQELKRAKDNMIGKTILALEASDNLASFYAEQELMEGKIETPENMFKKINKVTSKDIQEVACDIFRPEKLNMAIIGAFDDEKRFRDLLKI
ncbi:MAG TPA: pitrilysin family protein [Candidatus Paceibacterota bacterium]|nr:pitrilysin family protein [Candidatus Pacearchaeota archaeon]HRZ51340.1 pitrilysin family protein [Candidatus Paceibacterota bacterium]HSA37062.1 pitrilysin family protein [Candidatus Paceibacterota bacterium]